MIEIEEGRKLEHLDATEDRVAHAVHLLSERLRGFPARPLRVRLDGRDLSGDYLLLEALNIRFVGPSLDLAPASDPIDGLLDVVLVKESERRHLQRYLEGWQPAGPTRAISSPTRGSTCRSKRPGASCMWMTKRGHTMTRRTVRRLRSM